jgi:hypothetical protein
VRARPRGGRRITLAFTTPSALAAGGGLPKTRPRLGEGEGEQRFELQASLATALRLRPKKPVTNGSIHLRGTRTGPGLLSARPERASRPAAVPAAPKSLDGHPALSGRPSPPRYMPRARRRISHLSLPLDSCQQAP